MVTRGGRSTQDSRGQALVEFALIVPLFILILVGLFDAGRAVFNYSTIANAAREAARVAIVDQDEANIRAAAKAAGSGLTLQDSDIALGSCLDKGCAYSVTVTYDFEPATPLIGQLFNPTLSSTAVMPVEYENP